MSAPSQSIAYQAIIKPEQMAVYIDGQGFIIVPATLEFKVGSFIQPYLTGNVTHRWPRCIMLDNIFHMQVYEDKTTAIKAISVIFVQLLFLKFFIHILFKR